ncbi:hypothetical protein ACFWBB_39740 [Streptomyces sp. NPDC060000]|uniref:hypothetical protein n=1 Tax=Streptomyces sp. NPDC060000 TaxID=3347031 RepID=UPI0036945C5B
MPARPPSTAAVFPQLTQVCVVSRAELRRLLSLNLWRARKTYKSRRCQQTGGSPSRPGSCPAGLGQRGHHDLLRLRYFLKWPTSRRLTRELTVPSIPRQVFQNLLDEDDRWPLP